MQIEKVATLLGFRLAACLALSAMLVPAFPAAAISPVGVELGSGTDPYGNAVARVVRSISQYTRWSDESQPLRFCVIGPADHAGQISDFGLSRGRTMLVRRLRADAAFAEQCDAIYIGRMAIAEQREVVDAVRGREILTITENDPACRSRAMFCLLFQAESLSFRLNIDSVSRSGLRVDPRVLRLAASSGEGS